MEVQQSVSLTIRGRTFRVPLVRDCDARQAHRHALPAAYVGELTTRTSDSAGVITFSGAPPFGDTDQLDLFWAGGWRAFGVDGAPVGSAMTIAAAGDDIGDPLPAVGTAVTFSDPHRSGPIAVYDRPPIPLFKMMGFEPPKLMAISCTTRCLLQLADEFLGELPRGETWFYADEMDWQNTFSDGSISTLLAANAEAAAAEITILIGN